MFYIGLDNYDNDVKDILEAGSQVNERIKAALQTVGPNWRQSPFYTRSRVKSSVSLIGKLAKKQREPSVRRYGLGDVTDIVGLRLVTLYDEQLIDAIEIVLDIVRQLQTISEPVFRGKCVWDSIREAKFYPRLVDPQTEDDGLNESGALEDVYGTCRSFMEQKIDQAFARQRGIARLHKKKFFTEKRLKTRYSSMHIVANAFGYLEGRRIPVPVEFQIRTAAEDIWGEIDHHYSYKVRDNGVHSRRLARIYRDLSNDSGRLNTQISLIPPAIRTIKQHFDEVTVELDLFRRPENLFYFSVCLTYLEGVLGQFSGEISQALFGYRDAWEALCNDLIGKGPEKIAIMLACIDSITEHLRSASVEEEIRDLCLAITSFEHIRLRAIDLELFQFHLGMDKQKQEARSLHQELANLALDPGWKFHPWTLFNYWTAFLVRIYNPTRTKDQLLAAYRDMKTDKSLADWSIYRVVIPREIAAEEWEQGNRFWAGIPEAERLSHNVVIRELARWWGLALKFGKEAFDQSLIKNVRKGDITLGLSEDQKILDAANFLKYLLSYLSLTTSAEELAARFGIDDAYLKDVARAVRSNELRRAATVAGRGQEILDLLSKVLRARRLDEG